MVLTTPCSFFSSLMQHILCCFSSTVFCYDATTHWDISSCSQRTELPWKLNPLNAELNPICHLLALLGAHLIFHVSSIRVKQLYSRHTHKRIMCQQLLIICIGLTIVFKHVFSLNTMKTTKRLRHGSYMNVRFFETPNDVR
jgi:hypothetical protein